MSDGTVSLDRGRRLIFYGCLLLIAAAGTAARLWQAGESLWLDELHTSWVVSDGFDAIAPRAHSGNQNPLYFYVVRLSVAVWGNNELAVRLPSLAAGVGLIIVAGILVWRWCGAMTAGWLAAALVAVDHNMIFFAQEARAYALVQVVALLQFAAFWRLQTRPRRRDRLVVCGGWILLFYLHYTAILVMAGELLWWAAIQHWQRGRGAYRPAHVLCDMAVTSLACAIAGPHLAEIAARRSNWEMFIYQRPPWVALRWSQWDLYLASTVAVCAGLAVAAYFLRRRGRPRQAVLAVPDWLAVVPLLVAWWLVPVAIAWSLTAGDLARVFFPRYLLGVAVAPMLCAGLCLAACRGGPGRFVALIAVVAIAVWGNGLCRQYARDGRLIADRGEDWRGAVAWLNAVRDDASPVLVRSGLIEADQLGEDPSERLREFCVLPVTGLYRIQSPAAIYPLPTSHSGRLSREAIELLEQARGGWLVINLRPAARESLRRELRASIPGDRLRFGREKSFGNVAVWQVEIFP